MKMFKDITDNQLYAWFWTLSITGFVIIITGFTINSSLFDKQMHDLVSKGHDPVELACLYKAGNSSVTAPCLILIQERIKEKNNVSK